MGPSLPSRVHMASLLAASEAPPLLATLFLFSGPARGTHSIFSYFRRNSFHMCLIHSRLQKLEISSVQKRFQLFFFFFPFLETGSCVWLQTNYFRAPGTYKMFGMRNGEVWGKLLSSPFLGRFASARLGWAALGAGRIAGTFLSLSTEP